MKIQLNPYIEQVSPNGNTFRVSGQRLIHKGWNDVEVHVLIKKDSGDFQILTLDKNNNHKEVFKHPSVDYEKKYGKW